MLAVLGQPEEEERCGKAGVGEVWTQSGVGQGSAIRGDGVLYERTRAEVLGEEEEEAVVNVTDSEEEEDEEEEEGGEDD